MPFASICQRLEDDWPVSSSGPAGFVAGLRRSRQYAGCIGFQSHHARSQYGGGLLHDSSRHGMLEQFLSRFVNFPAARVGRNPEAGDEVFIDRAGGQFIESSVVEASKQEAQRLGLQVEG